MLIFAYVNMKLPKESEEWVSEHHNHSKREMERGRESERVFPSSDGKSVSALPCQFFLDQKHR